MTIPKLLTKAQHTRLTKKNLSFLIQSIQDQQGDLTIEAEFLNKIDLTNPYMLVHLSEYKDTIKSTTCEVKLAFRDFNKDKKLIDKAYQRYLDKKK